MARKPVVRRAVADRDAEQAIDYYRAEGGADLAVAFADTLQAGLNHISRQPGIGSPRHAHALNLPGLRCWPLTRFPHLVFYFERSDHVDVWRILHSRRDLPASLDEQADSGAA